MLQFRKNDMEDTLQTLPYPHIDHYQAHRIVGETYLHRINTKQPIHPTLLNAVKQQRYHALKLIQALTEVHASLSTQMPVLHIKGPSLSQLISHDPYVRTAKDIDLLVLKEDLACAHKLIQKLGYVRISPDSSITGKTLDVAIHFGSDFVYYNPKSGVCIECHYQLFLNPKLFTISQQHTLWQSTTSVTIGQTVYPTLSPAIYFLYLCTHVLRSGYTRLHWLYDVQAYVDIIGSRPERPEFVGQFKHSIPRYMKKHVVKAGITGLAQIKGFRGDTDLSKRVDYDLDYINRWSLWLDIKIICLTIFKVFKDKNAY